MGFTDTIARTAPSISHMWTESVSHMATLDSTSGHSQQLTVIPSTARVPATQLNSPSCLHSYQTMTLFATWLVPPQIGSGTAKGARAPSSNAASVDPGSVRSCLKALLTISSFGCALTRREPMRMSTSSTQSSTSTDTKTLPLLTTVLLHVHVYLIYILGFHFS